MCRNSASCSTNSVFLVKSAKKVFFLQKNVAKSAKECIFVIGFVLNKAKESSMNAMIDSVKFAMSAEDSAVLSRSFSVSCSGFWDAENREFGGYSLLQANGWGVDGSVCIALSCQPFSAGDSIRVGAGVCSLYRVIEEKLSGFVTVVRWSWRQFKQRLRSCFRHDRLRCKRCSPEHPLVLSYAGGLRL